MVNGTYSNYQVAYFTTLQRLQMRATNVLIASFAVELQMKIELYLKLQNRF